MGRAVVDAVVGGAVVEVYVGVAVADCWCSDVVVVVVDGAVVDVVAGGAFVDVVMKVVVVDDGGSVVGSIVVVVDVAGLFGGVADFGVDAVVANDVDVVVVVVLPNCDTANLSLWLLFISSQQALILPQ